MWYRSKLTLKQFAAGILTPATTRKIHATKKHHAGEENVEKAFQNFQQACERAKLSDIKNTLLVWARLHFF